MTGFISKLAKTLGLAEDPFPQKKDINPAEVYFKPFEELRALLVSWIEESRPQYAERQDYNPEQIGFIHRDAGGSAEVFTSPCKRFAIRVSRDNTDDGYQEFLKLALQRQNNPFYPKVYTVLQHGNRQVVLMECLTPIDLDDAEYDVVEMMHGDCRAGTTGNTCPHMRQLVKDIHAIVKHDMTLFDLFPDNALLRMTDTGRQIVVTDPIA